MADAGKADFSLGINVTTNDAIAKLRELQNELEKAQKAAYEANSADPGHHTNLRVTDAEKAVQAQIKAVARADAAALAASEKEIADHAKAASASVRDLGAGVREIEAIAGGGGGVRSFVGAIARLGPLAGAAVGAIGALATITIAYHKEEEAQLRLSEQLAVAGLGAARNWTAYQSALKNVLEETGRNMVVEAGHLAQLGVSGEKIGGVLKTIQQASITTGNDTNKAFQLVAETLKGSSEGWKEYGVYIDSALPVAEQMSQLQVEMAKNQELLNEQLKTGSEGWKRAKENFGEVSSGLGKLVSYLPSVNTALVGLELAAKALSKAARILHPEIHQTDFTLRNAATAASQLTDATKRLNTEERILKDNIADSNTALDLEFSKKKDAITATNDLAKAEGELEKKKIDRAVTLGFITAEEAKLKKDTIDAKSEQDAFAAQQALKALQIEQNQKEIDQINEKERARQKEYAALPEASRTLEQYNKLFDEFSSSGSEGRRRGTLYNQNILLRQQSSEAQQLQSIKAAGAGIGIGLDQLGLLDQIAPSLKGYDANLVNSATLAAGSKGASRFRNYRAAGAAGAAELGAEEQVYQQLADTRESLLRAREMRTEALELAREAAQHALATQREQRDASRANADNFKAILDNVGKQKRDIMKQADAIKDLEGKTVNNRYMPGG